MIRPYVDEEACIACGKCEEVCPADPNVYKVDTTSHVINPEACINCGACEEDCPTGAITLKE
ncbi:MAG TPA: 4Fe-4S binding protein [Armatimonadota bacterium]|jgi:NAD-dependent dihydropyrimidine dehydrogenase PreA subunit